MNKLACVVVLYNPETDSFIANLSTYSDKVDEVFIVDNSGEENIVLQKHLFKDEANRKKFIYLPNNGNEGIAKGLNKGCILAIKRGYDWCLLMDQDSSFTKEGINGYVDFFNTTVAKYDDIGVFTLAYSNLDNYDDQNEYPHAITSGSIINLNGFKKIGGHDERLFIDEVDTDYSLRIKLEGYRIVTYKDMKLVHKLGVLKRTGYFGLFFKTDRTIHSPFRLYYMVRNYLVVRKRFVSQFPAFFSKRDKDFKIMLKNNVLFSGSFFSASWSAFKGYIHYKKNKF